jgi:uncharacterized membrane protein
MRPELALLLWWVAFAATHIGLSSVRVRPRLTAALGEGAYRGLYSLIALATFVPLVWFYMSHRHVGAELWSLRHVTGVRTFSMWLSGSCFALSVASFFQPSPAGMGGGPPRVRGLLRITRHPLFVPIALLGFSHLLINGYATDVIFFGGLFVYGIAGCMHQDARKRVGTPDARKRVGTPEARKHVDAPEARKHVREQDAAFDAFLRQTSVLPFTAILAGRTELVWSELPWAGLAVGALAAIGFYQLHGWMFS